jgi:hypothetical protein
MKLVGTVDIKRAPDANGVLKPVSAGAWLERDDSDPPQPGNIRKHYISLDLLDPRPEDDPNSNISADDIASIKAQIAEATSDGIVVLPEPVSEAAGA